MSNTDSLTPLFQLGEIHPDDQWQDYPSYGITATHAPALLGLIGDTSLHNANVESDDIWVPQHAWRALGQVGDATSVKPLLLLLDDTLLSDVWAAQELPQVMGMIGKSAVDEFADYLNNSAHSECARIICAEGLKCVVEQFPECRGLAINGLTSYLATPDNTAPDLNGIVVCCLLDLDAKESIEEIRAVYDMGNIDISFAGDIEDVEIDLGLRLERETLSKLPGRAQGSVVKAMPIEEPGNSVDEEINHYLRTYSNNNSVNNVSELDGFFSALGSGPENIVPERWLASIWGGDEYIPRWKSKEEGDRFVSAVLVTYKRLLQALGSDTYSALFIDKKLDGKHIIIVDDWCKGFMRGLNMWGHLGTVDSLYLKESIQPIRLFVTQSGRERLNAMNDGGIAFQQKKN